MGANPVKARRLHTAPVVRSVDLFFEEIVPETQAKKRDRSWAEDYPLPVSSMKYGNATMRFWHHMPDEVLEIISMQTHSDLMIQAARFSRIGPARAEAMLDLAERVLKDPTYRTMKGRRDRSIVGTIGALICSDRLDPSTLKRIRSLIETYKLARYRRLLIGSRHMSIDAILDEMMESLSGFDLQHLVKRRYAYFNRSHTLRLLEDSYTRSRGSLVRTRLLHCILYRSMPLREVDGQLLNQIARRETHVPCWELLLRAMSHRKDHPHWIDLPGWMGALDRTLRKSNPFYCPRSLKPLTSETTAYRASIEMIESITHLGLGCPSEIHLWALKLLRGFNPKKMILESGSSPLERFSRELRNAWAGSVKPTRKQAIYRATVMRAILCPPPTKGAPCVN